MKSCSHPQVPTSAWMQPIGTTVLSYLALMPWLYSPVLASPGELPRWLGLIVTAMLLAVLWLFVWREHRFAFRWTLIRNWLQEPISFGAILLLVSATLSMLLSPARWTSFFGEYASRGGWISFASAFLIFASVRAWAHCTAFRRSAGIVLCLGMIGATTYGLFQTAKLDPWIDEEVSVIAGWSRPTAWLEHPIFLAAFLTMILPLLLGFTLEAAETKRWPAFVVLALLALLTIGVILATLSRGAWLALACSGSVGLLGLWSRPELRHWLPRLFALGLVGVVLVADRAATTQRGRELHQRVAERVSNFTESPSRRILWATAWQAFLDAPLFGVGTDQFTAAFTQRRPQEFWQHEWARTGNRAHNDLLHLLATQGVLAAIGVGGMLYGFVRSVLHHSRAPNQGGGWMPIALAATTVAFLVMGLTSFTRTIDGVILAVVAGLLTTTRSEQTKLPKYEFPRWLLLPLGLIVLALLIGNFVAMPQVDRVRGVALVGVTWALLGAGFWTLQQSGRSSSASDRTVAATGEPPPSGSASAVRRLHPTISITVMLPSPHWDVVHRLLLGVTVTLASAFVLATLIADAAYARANPHPKAPSADAIAPLEIATTWAPWNDVYWSDLGRAYESAAMQTTDPAEKCGWLRQARDAHRTAWRWHPLAAQHPIHLGRCLTWLALLGEADPHDVAEVFDAALRLDRANAYYFMEAGVSALRLRDAPRADRLITQGLQWYPNFGPLLSLDAQRLLLHGQVDQALARFDTARRADWHYFELDDWKTMVTKHGELLLRLKRYQAAASLMEEVRGNCPDVEEWKAIEQQAKRGSTKAASEEISESR